MTRLMFLLGGGLLALGIQGTVFAQNVVEDGGIGLSSEEIEYAVEQLWTPQMRQSAANDVGDRLELLTVTLANKRLAAEAEKMTAEADGDAYWDLQFRLRTAQRNFVLKRFKETIEVPDMTPLAAERYETQKEKYALVPERRISSHILFACPPASCSRSETKAKAQVVLDELRSGADFVEMVQQYSDDAGTKAKDGKFDKWMAFGEPQVARPYSDGVFEIAEIGQYSELVSSQFGIHIIRLDDIQEAYYRPFDEVKGNIVADLEVDYGKLALRDYLSQYQISDNAYIDGAAMEKIFSKYATELPAAPGEGGS